VFLRILGVFFCLLASLSASQLRVRVADPQNAVIPQARVAAYREQGGAALDVRTTGPEGTAILSLPDGRYTIEVLAPGFAPQQAPATLPTTEVLNVQVRVSSPAETVDVSATRTPLPAEEAASSVASLAQDQLVAMQPTAASEAIRFMPGAVINSAGRRGGQASLFVRGGESRYNKVIIDDVSVNDPGGTFDFGVVPMEEVERVEFVRGAHSSLYGSDAMTSTVQFFTRTGTTRTPELRFGADGGNFATARGYASLAGARDPFDFNLFGQQFNSEGQGINDKYSNSSQGANIGVRLNSRSFFRLRTRHSNSFSGIQSFWNFNGQPLVPPDTDQWARQNNFLASGELTIAVPSGWTHRITGFEYNHKRRNVDNVMDEGRETSAYGFPFNFDTPFDSYATINRAGLEYQGEYWTRNWARSTFGYRFEVENGFVGDRAFGSHTHGLRRNHAIFGQEVLTWSRVSVIGGLRWEHNETFGDKAIPRVAVSLLALRGGELFSGTRVRFAYATGIKEPRLEESFASGPFTIPNLALQAEENRSLEAGIQQRILGDKYLLVATYYRNLFRNQITYATVDPINFIGQYLNLNRALAHGAEVEFHGRPTRRLSVDAAYTHASTQILRAPFAFDPLLSVGRPLLRRPKHSATFLATWTSVNWGANLGAVAVGRRTDSDFFGLQPPVTYAAGYARFDVGGWRAINSRITAYVNLENLLGRDYEEVAGYPALGRNFRLGMRFRVGGE